MLPFEIIAIVVAGFFVALLVDAFLIGRFTSNQNLEQRNAQFMEKNPHLHGKNRMLCVQCKYYRTNARRPHFRFGPGRSAAVSSPPAYCGKFKRELKPVESLRCISHIDEQAMWEE